jgi:DNA-binding NarL/FixJ family response regulator
LGVLNIQTSYFAPYDVGVSDPGDAASLRVLIADDHPVYRMGLRDLLAREGFSVVGETDSGDKALELAHELKPDVVIMDVKLPVVDGIEAARRIKDELPDTRVVMVTGFEADHTLVQAIEAGAGAFVTKGEETEALVRAVRETAEGKAFLPPSIAKRVMGIIAEAGGARGTRAMPYNNGALTEREVNVLRLLAAGKRNREIAALLGISERTVGNHIQHIYAKLRVKDRPQAIMYAIRKGIIKL